MGSEEVVNGVPGTESVLPGTSDFKDCLNCHRGWPCRKCKAGVYAVPPLLVPNGLKSQENAVLNRKRARFLVRAFRGVSCGLAKGYRFRWFALTESDQALERGADFGKEFNRFRTWLKYSCRDFEYIGIEHRQGKPSEVTGDLRRNWHILSYGSDRLPVADMRDYWQARFQSTVTGMAEIKDIGKAVKYLAGYLSHSDKFVRCWFSQGWVFPGWIGFSRRYKQKYGDYLPTNDLVTLASMTPKARSYELEWLLLTGYLSSHYQL